LVYFGQGGRGPPSRCLQGPGTGLPPWRRHQQDRLSPSGWSNSCPSRHCRVALMTAVPLRDTTDTLCLNPRVTNPSFTFGLCAHRCFASCCDSKIKIKIKIKQTKSRIIRLLCGGDRDVGREKCIERGGEDYKRVALTTALDPRRTRGRRTASSNFHAREEASVNHWRHGEGGSGCPRSTGLGCDTGPAHLVFTQEMGRGVSSRWCSVRLGLLPDGVDLAVSSGSIEAMIKST
jgi:hypothetical protein